MKDALVVLMPFMHFLLIITLRMFVHIFMFILICIGAVLEVVHTYDAKCYDGMHIHTYIHTYIC